jgi:hypothetical protein
MRRLAIACLVLAACSHIFGLDYVSPDDRDGDHWPDGDDNCPNDYNPDQSDVDGDGVGDRCQLCMSPSGLDDDGDGIPNECDGCDNRLPDTNHDGVPDACEHLNDAGMIVITPPDAACPLCAACPLGPPHDEDNDEVADACDDCPILPSLIESGDSDGDGVGDQCDVSPLPSYQIFDAFAEPNQNWLQTGVWTVAHDQVHVALNIGPHYRQLGTAVAHFVIRTKLIDSGGTNGDATAGVMTARDANLDATNADEKLQCGVRASFASTSGISLVLHQESTSAQTPDQELPLPTAPSYRVELEYNAGAKQISCSANAGTGQLFQIKVQEANPSTMAWTTGLYAASGGGSADFEYFEMVSDK